MKSKPRILCLLAALSFVCLPSHADVPTPPTPPAVPAGYCTTIATEVQGYMDAFNASIGTPPQIPVLHTGQLQQADSNAGPSVDNALPSSLAQAQELQAMGMQAVKITIGFPLLYEPFWGSQSAMQPYLNFYQTLVSDLHAMGLKVIIQNTILLANQPEAGWTNVTSFYAGLTWPEYMAARATMAQTIAQQVNPDFLILGEEPDTEALTTGQSSLSDPVQAALMIAGEITAVRLVNLTIKLGAGFGTWLGAYPPAGLLEYVLDYIALPLDYIDYHVYPILTWQGASYLNNALLIAQQAQLAGKPVAVSESWAWKTEDAEYNVQPSSFYRGRNPFSFWAPIDSNFGQTMQNLVNYTQANYTPVLYLSTEGTDYLFAYQTYGGTVANGGAANCTCTTDSCTESIVLSNGNNDASVADQAPQITATGLSYHSRQVNPPDTNAPSTPGKPGGTAGYNSVSMAWTASTDDVGVAGYNILRCAPVPPSTTCTGVWIGNTALTQYVDTGLTDNTTYQYQVQAFDMVNNESGLSAAFSVTTAPSTPPNSPSGVMATAQSPSEIIVKWTAPATGTVSQYQIWSGPSASSLQQVATAPGSKTQYTHQPLNPSTTYCYGIVAVENKLSSPISNIACSTTLPLPNSPSNVVATPSSATKITITWQETIPPGGLSISSYQVYRGTTNGDFTKIANTTAKSYSNTGLTPGTTYYYEIVAADTSHNNSVPSVPVSATTYAAPPAPDNVQMTASAATKFKVAWTWSAASGGLAAGHFTIYCGTSPTGETKYGQAAGGAGPNFSFSYTQATAATKYFCYVVATDTANDNSVNSATANVTTPPIPNAPTNVMATANSSTKVTVTWSESNPPPGLSISSYKIYRSTTLPVTTAGYLGQRTTKSYTDSTVVGGTTYYYAISAIDSGQDASALSAPATVTTP
ncbi:MAG TPA: fibronectin type III domain-containing protein [Bryobacteraceae bacterium]|nr:fibronectin type III domain-containing protein [Bryobacteraceae bacterium]